MGVARSYHSVCEPTLHDELGRGADGGAQAVGGVAAEHAIVVFGLLIDVGLNRPRAIVQNLGEQNAVLHPAEPVRVAKRHSCIIKTFGKQVE